MGADSQPPTPPSEAEVLSWFETLSNWGRWGPDDELGTLNFITPEIRCAAAALVTEGASVSCGLDLTPRPQEGDIFGPLQRFMGFPVMSGDELPNGQPSRMTGAAEYLGMVYHTVNVTHIDSLAHISWDGQLYNGAPAAAVSTRQGATVHAVTAAKSGIVTRGVLLDIPRLHERSWLEPGDAVFPEDLEAAEAAQGLRVREGDALLLRTGDAKRRRQQPGPHRGQPGFHAACLPWLRDRCVALIASDRSNDVIPSGYDFVPAPMHAVGIPIIGLWLVDNCDLEPLADACAARHRHEFHLQIAPLPVEGGTGSPVNPIATF